MLSFCLAQEAHGHTQEGGASFVRTVKALSDRDYKVICVSSMGCQKASIECMIQVISLFSAVMICFHSLKIFFPLTQLRAQVSRQQKRRKESPHAVRVSL